MSETCGRRSGGILPELGVGTGLLPVDRGRYALHLPEPGYEIGNVVESACRGNFRNGLLGGSQSPFCPVDPDGIQIIREGFSREFFKVPGEVAVAEIDLTAAFLGGEIFRVMTVDD